MKGILLNAKRLDWESIAHVATVCWTMMMLALLLIFSIWEWVWAMGESPLGQTAIAPTPTQNAPIQTPSPSSTTEFGDEPETFTEFWWGTDTGWAIGRHIGYASLMLPAQDFYVGKIGCGGWRGENCNNLEEIAISDIAQVFAENEPPPAAMYTYWYLYGPVRPYLRHPVDGVSDPSEYGAEQARKFYATYMLKYQHTYRGNTVFVDIESTAHAWEVADHQLDNGSEKAWTLWRKNRQVVDGFLYELRRLFQGDVTIGVYTGWPLYDIVGLGYEFPFPVVLWYAQYPTETDVCTIQTRDKQIVSINSLEVSLRKFTRGNRQLLEYIQDEQIFNTSIGGYAPVIWQFCNNWGSVSVQDPEAGFSPRRATSWVPTPTPTETPEIKTYTIGVQVGHLGSPYGPGASCPDGAVEAEINLAVAQQIVEILSVDPVHFDVVVLAGMAEMVHEFSGDAFVALHADSCDYNLKGYKVSTWNGLDRGIAGLYTGDGLTQSNRLATAIWLKYPEETGLVIDATPASERSIDCFTNYYALNPVQFGPICDGTYTSISGIDPSTPGVIIEMGFMGGDHDFLLSDDGQRKAARGIVYGILEFIGGEK